MVGKMNEMTRDEILNAAPDKAAWKACLIETRDGDYTIGTDGNMIRIRGKVYDPFNYIDTCEAELVPALSNKPSATLRVAWEPEPYYPAGKSRKPTFIELLTWWFNQ